MSRREKRGSGWTRRQDGEEEKRWRDATSYYQQIRVLESAASNYQRIRVLELIFTTSDYLERIFLNKRCYKYLFTSFLL